MFRPFKRILTPLGEAVFVVALLAALWLSLQCAAGLPDCPYDPGCYERGESIDTSRWDQPRDAAERALLAEYGEGDAGMLALCQHRGSDAYGQPCPTDGGY